MKIFTTIAVSVVAVGGIAGAAHAEIDQSQLQTRTGATPAPSIWVQDPQGDAGHWTDMRAARTHYRNGTISVRISKFGDMGDDVFVVKFDTDRSRPGYEYKLTQSLKIVKLSNHTIVGHATITNVAPDSRRYSFRSAQIGNPKAISWSIVVPGVGGDRLPDQGNARTELGA